jgi:hypothetical protein
VKRLGREVGHSPLSNSKLKNAWNDISNFLIFLHGADKDRFSSYFLLYWDGNFIPAMQSPSGNVKVQAKTVAVSTPLLHCLLQNIHFPTVYLASKLSLSEGLVETI